MSGVAGSVPWRRYVAIGDSFTEGLNDASPDGAGFRGWADLVAARLAAEHHAAAGPGLAAEAEPARFRYANLAVRGRLFHSIVDEQVPRALRMDPDLVSFAAGGNDVLRRSFDPEHLVARFDEVVRMLRAYGADVILFRFADITTRLPGKRIVLPRVAALNQAVIDVAQRHGAYLVDMWQDREFGNPLLWSEDRLHLNDAGHRRVAAHVLTALRLCPEPSWLDSPAVPPHPSWLRARQSDAQWVGRHLAPWLKRRLAGTSSGDVVTAKRPALTPVVD